VILLDGDGYKPAAKQWLKAQVNRNGALIAVWDMKEFQTQANNGLFRLTLSMIPKPFF
jgi:hypothetical protein